MKCHQNAITALIGKYVNIRMYVVTWEVKAMTKEEALKAFEKMLSEIDKDNWLFVGTINPQMVEWAIKALKGEDDE